MFLIICVATTRSSHAEEQSLIEAGVVGTQKVFNVVFYEIYANIIFITVNCTSLLEEKIIAVTTYLGCSREQNLIVRDCPSTQKETIYGPKSLELKQRQILRER